MIGKKINAAKRAVLLLVLCSIFFADNSFAYQKDREARRKGEMEELQRRFEWWPTDAKPGPVKDAKHGGYWWWPTQPGKIRPWGNRGYVYVYKIIFDYREEELPPPVQEELRPSLLVRKIVKNVKVYFDYDKADLREDAERILKDAAGTLRRNPETSILITGNCDRRGSEAYNDKLGKRRGDTVKRFMLENGVSEDRIRIISRGKLDAIAPINDLAGMQKDRNAQFMIAEVEEVMIPYSGAPQEAGTRQVDEGKFLIEKEEKIESGMKVSTEEYSVKKGDSLSSIAREHLGGAHRWKYLYELNKDRIDDPNKLKVGQKVIIPVE